MDIIYNMCLNKVKVYNGLAIHMNRVLVRHMNHMLGQIAFLDCVMKVVMCVV